jgi:hypothetical protein
LAYIGADFDEPRPSPFDHTYMRALYDYGYAAAMAGRLWHKSPPGLHTTRSEHPAGAAE